MSIEQLFSQITLYAATKKRNRRSHQGFKTFWVYLIIALKLMVACPDLSLTQIVLLLAPVITQLLTAHAEYKYHLTLLSRRDVYPTFFPYRLLLFKALG